MKKRQLHIIVTSVLILSVHSYAAERKIKISPTPPDSPTVVHLHDTGAFTLPNTPPTLPSPRSRVRRPIERSASAGNRTPHIITPLRSISSPLSDPELFSEVTSPQQLRLDCGRLGKVRSELADNRPHFLVTSSRPLSPHLAQESQEDLTFYTAEHVIHEIACMMHALNSESREINSTLLSENMTYFMSLHEKLRQDLDTLRKPFLSEPALPEELQAGTDRKSSQKRQDAAQKKQDAVRKLICRNQERESLLLRDNRDSEKCRKDTLLNRDLCKAELQQLRMELAKHKNQSKPEGLQLRERGTSQTRLSVTSPVCHDAPRMHMSAAEQEALPIEAQNADVIEI